MRIEIPISPNLEPILQAFTQAYFTGGCVRDALCGITPKDVDIEIHGHTAEEIEDILSHFGKVNTVGQSFGVLKMTVDDEDFDFSLPRKDNKIGAGHKDFSVEVDPEMGTKAACRRRDFTINSLLVHTNTWELVDHYNGVADLQAGILRHVDAETFKEDPLRVLRGLQFCGRFGLQADPETEALCQEMKDEFSTISPSRFWEEWAKWASKSTVPSAGLTFLKNSGWIEHYPEINKLIGIPQDPTHHPEGDAWVHTLHCVDAMAAHPEWKSLSAQEKTISMMGILCHDLGKATNTASRIDTKRIVSPGHDLAGRAPAQSFLENIGAPKYFIPPILTLVEEHMIYLKVQPNWNPEEGKAREVGRRLAKKLKEQGSNPKELFRVMASDHAGRPPKSPEIPVQAQALRTALQKDNLWEVPYQAIFQGKDLIPLNVPTGPGMGKVLKQLEEAQLQGKFFTKDEGVAYFKKNQVELLREAQLLPPALLSFDEIEKLCCPGNKPEAKRLLRLCFRQQIEGTLTNPEQAKSFLLQKVKKEEPELP